MSGKDPYLLGYRREEQERLERQAGELGEESDWLFEQIGVAAGWRAVEIGCGPRGCLAELARRVGAAGRVVGVEASPEQAATANRFAAESHLANIEVLCANGRATELPAGSFDLATSRLVLVNVPEPEQIAAEMVRLTRPGGFVAFHEPDASTNRVDPAHPALGAALELLVRYGALHGIDRSIGPRVPRMLRELGLVDVRMHPRTHIYPLGHGRRMLIPDFVENARSRMLDAKLIAEAELDELVRALRRHLEDPNTLVISSVYLQVWGRKPAL